MVFTKQELRSWEKERLIETLISFQKANDSLAAKILCCGDELEEIQKKYLTLNQKMNEKGCYGCKWLEYIEDTSYETQDGGWCCTKRELDDFEPRKSNFMKCFEKKEN